MMVAGTMGIEIDETFFRMLNKFEQTMLEAINAGK